MAKTPTGTTAKPKPQGGKAPLAKAPLAKAAKPATPKPAETPVADAGAEAASGVLRFKDLVEQVVQATGAKPKDAKEIALATLAAMGAALGRGEGLNLPEFGKGRIARSSVDAAGNAAIVLKLRRGEGKKKEGDEALAEAAE